MKRSKDYLGIKKCVFRNVYFENHAETCRFPSNAGHGFYLLHQKYILYGAPRGQCRSNHRRGKTHHQKLCQLAIPTRTSNCWHHHHHHQQVIWVARKEIYSFLCTHCSPPQLTTTVTSSHFQSGTERRGPETTGFPLIATLSTLFLRRCVAINRDKFSFLVTPT